MTAGRAISLAAGAAGLVILTSACASPFRTPGAERVYPQTYLRAPHNWEFRARYPDTDGLFNAFDYGHAILYETLLEHPADAARRLDGDEIAFITTKLLRHPPSVPLEERAIGPHYGTLVPELIAMFEWAHMLHRQIYDVWADEWLSPEQKDAAIRALLRYYHSRSDLALSGHPKSMDLMEGQRYSLSFRHAIPKFNGLMWSYHWLQMAIYDAMLTGRDAAERREQVDSTVARFFVMIDSAPANMPSVMPMSAAVAPVFSERYPDAAIVFDNLHALHDVVSDVLASPLIPAHRKRAAILEAAAHYRDDTTAVTSREEWLTMSRAMDADRMGGVAIRNGIRP